jgi:predicted PurR-regulated permease PerM
VTPPRNDMLRVWGLRAWWLLGIAGAVYVLFRFLGRIEIVVLPLILGLFPAAVLMPANRWLRERGWRPSLAALGVLTPAVGSLVLVFALIGPSLVDGLSNLGSDLSAAAESLRAWLVEGPLGLSEDQIDSYWDQAVSGLTDNGPSALLGGAATAVEIVAGALLTVVVAFFLLKDGDRMIDGLVDYLGDERGPQMAAALHVGRTTLGKYLGGLAIVGLFEGVVIAIGLAVVGVPLILPLAVLVFFGSFFPIVGAWLTGLVAVLVALVNGGLGDAVAILVIITGAQQTEGNFITPAIFGSTLPLHPLAVLLGVIGAGALFGIVGAFLIVPAMAAGVAAYRVLNETPEPDSDARSSESGGADDEAGPTD